MCVHEWWEHPETTVQDNTKKEQTEQEKCMNTFPVLIAIHQRKKKTTTGGVVCGAKRLSLEDFPTLLKKDSSSLPYEVVARC